MTESLRNRTCPHARENAEASAILALNRPELTYGSLKLCVEPMAEALYSFGIGQATVWRLCFRSALANCATVLPLDRQAPGTETELAQPAPNPGPAPPPRPWWWTRRWIWAVIGLVVIAYGVIKLANAWRTITKDRPPWDVKVAFVGGQAPYNKSVAVVLSTASSGPRVIHG